MTRKTARAIIGNNGYTATDMKQTIFVLATKELEVHLSCSTRGTSAKRRRFSNDWDKHYRKAQVTNMGSIIGQNIHYNGLEVLTEQKN